MSEAILECRKFFIKGGKRKEKGIVQRLYYIQNLCPGYEPWSESSFYTQEITLDSTTHYKP